MNLTKLNQSISKLSKKELAEIKFTYNISKYVKSNAIVLCNNFSTIGIGAGQPSRLDSCKIAVQKAKQFQSSKIRNSIAASDAFFPFADGINALIKAGVKTIEKAESLTIFGCKVIGGCSIDSELDHRIAMSFLILGLISKEPIKVLRPSTIETSFPNFYKLMIELGANFTKE